MNEERLAQMCLTLWPMLTEEEKESYCEGLGTLSFIENVAALLTFYEDGELQLPDDEVLESILDRLEALDEQNDCE